MSPLLGAKIVAGQADQHRLAAVAIDAELSIARAEIALRSSFLEEIRIRPQPHLPVADAIANAQALRGTVRVQGGDAIRRDDERGAAALLLGNLLGQLEAQRHVVA